jgi:hypothetical protein
MKLRSTLAAAALLATALGVAGPASAQTTTVVDGADATGSLSDIRRVTLAHQTDKVVVRTTFTDLTTDSAAGLRINIDTNAARVGPEFVLVSGLGEGTDYFLLEARDWRMVGEPLGCAHHLRIDWTPTWRASPPRVPASGTRARSGSACG